MCASADLVEEFKEGLVGTGRLSDVSCRPRRTHSRAADIGGKPTNLGPFKNDFASDLEHALLSWRAIGLLLDDVQRATSRADVICFGASRGMSLR